MRHEEVTPVAVSVSRFNGTADEITITVTIPADAEHGKRKVYVSMTPAAFALALTGMSEQQGEMCVYEFQKKKAANPTTP